jgi:hypothetical protein
MPIVFDQVDGVIQRSPETGEPAPAAEPEEAEQGAPVNLDDLHKQLRRAQQRHERRMAD